MASRTSSKHATPGIPRGTFREKRKSAPSYDELAWAHEVSEILTLPPSAPPADVYPDIETALLAASDQLHRRPSQPELPPLADKYRRAKP
jgi:hypothetical protein